MVSNVNQSHKELNLLPPPLTVIISVLPCCLPLTLLGCSPWWTSWCARWRHWTCLTLSVSNHYRRWSRLSLSNPKQSKFLKNVKSNQIMIKFWANSDAKLYMLWSDSYLFINIKEHFMPCTSVRVNDSSM